MNFLQLRAFHGVASVGSFTGAAERLHVTQPTLSGQVKDLEQGFGIKLFERRGRGVVTTELGGRLLAITRQIFSLEAEAEQLLAGARALARGRLPASARAEARLILARMLSGLIVSASSKARTAPPAGLHRSSP